MGQPHGMALHHHDLRIHENGDDGEMAWGILKSTTPKGVAFCGERRQTG